MRRITLALLVAVALGAGPHTTGVAAAQLPAAAGEVQAHDGMNHGAMHPTPSEGPTDYLTLNVAVSDEALRPAAVFVPAGRPVQLVLRNRGSMEHHYRVVGLRPDDLFWVS
ncbi:MAG: DsbD protein, partial [Acidobacteria bacterium]|nr:DsbD protein [Acidobacteriota bacterium]